MSDNTIWGGGGWVIDMCFALKKSQIKPNCLVLLLQSTL